MYQITLNMTGGSIDATTPFASILGPNGENKTTLEGLGWSFSSPTTSRITIGRPGSKQVQPLVNIMTHGINGGVVVSKAPTGTSSATHSAIQTYSSNNWTTLDIYSITNATVFCASSGSSTTIITFGLIS
jgi:hypothetical protein